MGVLAFWVGLGVMVALLVGFVMVILPRSAHVAFERGNLGSARLRYRLLARVSPTRARRASARVSVAACWLALGDASRGAALLARVDVTGLGDAARAAWLNNRAYAALKSSADTADTADAAGTAGALAWADEAVSLRPDVPGLVHTRGLALLAAGRTDDAIRSFEEMWELGELPPRLEAERCRDLARAWEAKGHGDYAADYRARAARVFPGGLGGPNDVSADLPHASTALDEPAE